jgi:hypothetical protein
MYITGQRIQYGPADKNWDALWGWEPAGFAIDNYQPYCSNPNPNPYPRPNHCLIHVQLISASLIVQQLLRRATTWVWSISGSLIRHQISQLLQLIPPWLLIFSESRSSHFMSHVPCATYYFSKLQSQYYYPTTVNDNSVMLYTGAIARPTH